MTTQTADPGKRDALEGPVRTAGLFRAPSLIMRSATQIYMVRWVLIRVFGWELKFNLFLASDPDCLHDHPWPFLSVMLSGSYTEHTSYGAHKYRAPCILWRPAPWRHRIEIHEPCLTMNISAPKRRNWGFWTPAGWVIWRKYKPGVHRCD